MRVFREYKCPNCGHWQEKLAHFDDEVICEECTSVTQRQISAPAVTNGNSAHGNLKKGRGFN